MIPKIIHYCWFGGNEMPQKIKKCLASWKKYCPDYEIKEWNESNFDVNSNIYTQEAFQLKKWAFITDYVRLYVLSRYGGVYMDTDVELIKPIDILLENKAFTGFETESYIPTGIIASEQNNEWVNYLLSYYDNRHFLLENGEPDLTTNVITITNMTKDKYPVKLDNTFQVVDDVVTFYPKDYFCPFNNNTGKLDKTKNTYCIHWFSKSWESSHNRFRAKITRPFHRIFGDNCFAWIHKILK